MSTLFAHVCLPQYYTGQTDCDTQSDLRSSLIAYDAVTVSNGHDQFAYL